MTRMIWDKFQCRWVPWLGSKAKWLALPRAVVIGSCLSVSGASAHTRSVPIVPRSYEKPYHNNGYYQPEPGTFIPNYQNGYDFYGDNTRGNEHYYGLGTICNPPGAPGVPEPSSFLLLGTCIVSLITVSLSMKAKKVV